MPVMIDTLFKKGHIVADYLLLNTRLKSTFEYISPTRRCSIFPLCVISIYVTSLLHFARSSGLAKFEFFARWSKDLYIVRSRIGATTSILSTQDL